VSDWTLRLQSGQSSYFKPMPTAPVFQTKAAWGYVR